MVIMMIGLITCVSILHPESIQGEGNVQKAVFINKKVFRVAIYKLAKDKGEVIILVIEYFLADAVKDIEDTEMMNIAGYLNTIKEKVLNKSEIRFGLVQLVLCPVHQWYTNSLDSVCKKK